MNVGSKQHFPKTKRARQQRYGLSRKKDSMKFRYLPSATHSRIGKKNGNQARPRKAVQSVAGLSARRINEPMNNKKCYSATSPAFTDAKEPKCSSRKRRR